MEEIVNTIKQKYKYAADYGFILAGYIAVFFILDYLFPKNGIVNILNMLGFLGTPIVCFILAKRYRDRGCNGIIRFGQAWTFGLLLFVFTSLIMAVLYYVRFQFLQPDYITESFNLSLQMMEQMKYPQEYLDAMIDFGAPSAFLFTLTYLWIYIVGGALLFLIVAPFVVRKDTNMPTPSKSDDTPYEPYQDNKNLKE
jgi:hypothetical protein